MKLPAQSKGFTRFQVRAGNLILQVEARDASEGEARASVLSHLEQIESFTAREPEFGSTKAPFLLKVQAPAVVESMARTSELAGVGPRAVMPAALTEMLARDLGKSSREVVVSCGGCFFCIGVASRTFLFDPSRLGLCLRVAGKSSYGLYSSHGQMRAVAGVGASRGIACLAESACLASACAWGMEKILAGEGLAASLAVSKRIDGVYAGVVLTQERIGLWGDVEIVPSPGAKRHAASTLGSS